MSKSKNKRRLVENKEIFVENHALNDDAEKIEHFLSEEKVAEIERQLDFPEVDPHGQPIPGRDIV